MSWFRLDDQGAFHEKVLNAGNEAYGAWCRAGQWSSAHLTEGRIPRAIALVIAKPNTWEKLVAVGLCESTSDGWRIHDYLDWNPTSEEVIEKKAKRADAGRKGGIKSGATRRLHGNQPTNQPSTTNEANREAIASSLLQANEANPEASDKAIACPIAKQKRTPSPSPSPSRGSDPPVNHPPEKSDPKTQPKTQPKTEAKQHPEPKPSHIRRKPATEPEIPIPDDFAVSAELEAICRRENLPNPHAVLPDFRDWAEDKQVKKARWEATFRRWMRSKITADKYPPWNETEPLRALNSPVVVTPEQVERRRTTNATIQAALAEMDARVNGVAQ